MTKISELPDYDTSNISPDDLIPVVQDGVTKAIRARTIGEAEAYFEGNLSPTPSAAQLEAIVGIPEQNSAVVVKDTTGGGGVYFVTYIEGFWYYCPLTEAA